MRRTYWQHIAESSEGFGNGPMNKYVLGIGPAPSKRSTVGGGPSVHAQRRERSEIFACKAMGRRSSGSRIFFCGNGACECALLSTTPFWLNAPTLICKM